MLTIELPRADGVTIVEGSTLGTGADLDAFLDAGDELLLIPRVYQQLISERDSLAKLHFAHAESGWEFRYGLSDDVDRVIVMPVTDEEYAHLQKEARGQADPE